MNISSKVKEHVFTNRQEMSLKMEKMACEYEGYVPGRTGYNFPNKDGSYTIAYLKGDTLTKNHELYHARYYFDPEHREKTKKLWLNLKPEERMIIENFLSRCGYKRDVFLDELQAYWFSEKDPRKFFGLKREI